MKHNQTQYSRLYFKSNNINQKQTVGFPQMALISDSRAISQNSSDISAILTIVNFKQHKYDLSVIL